MVPYRILSCIACVAWLGGCAAAHGPAVEHPESAVVAVSAGSRMGQGFFVSADGLVVTSASAVARGVQVSVIEAGHVPVAAEVVQVDGASDLAILRVPGEEAHAFLALHVEELVANQHARVLTNVGAIHGRFDHWENSGRDLLFVGPVPAEARGAPLVLDDGTVIGVVREAGPGAGEVLATPVFEVWRLLPQFAPKADQGR